MRLSAAQAHGLDEDISFGANGKRRQVEIRMRQRNPPRRRHGLTRIPSPRSVLVVVEDESGLSYFRLRPNMFRHRHSCVNPLRPYVL